MAKAKMKVKKKLPTVQTGPMGGSVPSANTGMIGSMVGSANKVPMSGVPSANKVAATSVPKADNVTQQMALMEQEAEMARNADLSQGMNIYDPEIGYGKALEKESGRSAVERIKESRKAKVKRKGK